MAGAHAVVLVVPAAIYFLSYFHRVAPGVVAADLMQAFSITAASLGVLAAIYPYVFVAMAFVPGSLVETLGRRTLPLVVCTALYVVCWIALVAPLGLRPSIAMLGPLFFVMGLAASSLILVWSCVREVNDPAHVGIVIGFCNAPIFLAFGLLQWLLGAILDASWVGLETAGVRIYPEGGYRASFGVCLALAAGSLAMALLVTETRCRNIWGRAAH